MPTRDRFGVIFYPRGEALPPKKWYMARFKTSAGHEDMPFWQVGGRFIAVLVVIAAIVFALYKVGMFWDENTYGVSDCVSDRMAEYVADYGQQGEAFRPKVESDCEIEYGGP